MPELPKIAGIERAGCGFLVFGNCYLALSFSLHCHIQGIGSSTQRPSTNGFAQKQTSPRMNTDYTDI
jgi:hypothetical protein